MAVNKKTKNKVFCLYMCVYVCVGFLEVLEDQTTSSSLVNVAFQTEKQNVMELLPILYHQLVTLRSRLRL